MEYFEAIMLQQLHAVSLIILTVMLMERQQLFILPSPFLVFGFRIAVFDRVELPGEVDCV
jgi:hypothetical protein